VKNTGDRAGDEVVQMYLRPLQPKHLRALMELRGFERVALNPGEDRTVSFTFTPEKDLRHYDDERSAYAIDPGTYEVQVGASSADVRLVQRFTVSAE
jgi:beta-glucosidase